MGHYFFTSESVCKGHPDKAADQVADAILDAAITQDKNSRVSCEVLLSHNLIVLAGEISTEASLDYQAIARKTLDQMGYGQEGLGFDCHKADILLAIKQQSPDIARGVLREDGLLGAGDQGMMFGYASSETVELMPLPIMAAHKIVQGIDQARMTGKLPYLRPDGKVQVTFEYSEKGQPIHLHTVVISVHHGENVSQEEIQKDMKALSFSLYPQFIDERTQFYINPTGRFLMGGPAADCGITGRKIMVDTYGGAARHGGGAFSGKDPTKVDRSGAYAARYAAKNVVAAGLATKCELQIAYAIGVSDPVSIKVDTFGTGRVSDTDLSSAIQKLFPFSLSAMMKTLELKRPIYEKTAYGGHFGRLEPQFSWEKTDLVDELNRYF